MLCMSCHAIGHGMSEMMNDIFGLYDEGKIPKNSMFEILEVVKSGTFCCDGNIYETMNYVCHNRCILCLNQKDESELVSQYNLLDNIDISDLTEVLEDIIRKYQDYCICESCMKQLLLDNRMSAEKADELIKKSYINY